MTELGRCHCFVNSQFEIALHTRIGWCDLTVPSNSNVRASCNVIHKQLAIVSQASSSKYLSRKKNSNFASTKTTTKRSTKLDKTYEWKVNKFTKEQKRSQNNLRLTVGLDSVPSVSRSQGLGWCRSSAARLQ